MGRAHGKEEIKVPLPSAALVSANRTLDDARRQRGDDMDNPSSLRAQLVHLLTVRNGACKVRPPSFLPSAMVLTTSLPTAGVRGIGTG